MSQNTATTNGGISFLGALAIVFIALKLMGVITWSWWWVTAPLWGGLAIAVVLLAVAAILYMVGMILGGGR